MFEKFGHVMGIVAPCRNDRRGLFRGITSCSKKYACYHLPMKNFCFLALAQVLPLGFERRVTQPLALVSQRGFTLIELMIVVGIIGILVAIAAPNFSRYQSKARQSEAKIALAAVYGAEKSFYSEYSAYLSSFDAIGYAPEGQKRFYSVGWSAAGGTATGYSGGSATGYYARTAYPAAWSTCTTALSGLAAALSTADNQSFTASARGQIRDGTNCDHWDIDSTKVLKNTTINL